MPHLVSVPSRWFPVAVAPFLAALILPAVPSRSLAQEPRSGQWISLFDGKTLTGWIPRFNGHEPGVNYRDTFRVENGVLKVSYDNYPEFKGEFGHLFYREKFSHYRLRLEYRFVGSQVSGGPKWALRNSGVMIHAQAAETMRKDQEFPVSLEMQFLGGDGVTSRTTGNLCTPGTNVVLDGELHLEHCHSSSSETYDGDQWVTAEVEVHGAGTIRHLINGRVVLEYEKPQLDERDEDARKLIRDGDLLIREGYIALQAESHPVEFRKIELLPLSQ